MFTIKSLITVGLEVGTKYTHFFFTFGESHVCLYDVKYNCDFAQILPIFCSNFNNRSDPNKVRSGWTMEGKIIIDHDRLFGSS